MKLLSALAGVLLVPVCIAAPGQPVECAKLAALALPATQIVSAESVVGGNYVAGRESGARTSYAGLPDFCEVRGIATPVRNSRIGFTVWLPLASQWSGRLHMVGNGGYGSNLYYEQLVARIRRGDVAVATDTGHTGSALTFGQNNPEAIVDWGNRAVHESVVAAKSILAAFYGRAQRYAYFSGSSTGGHQALMVAQRHPQDFDGIIAGAPGNNRTNLNLSFLWEFIHNHRPGDNSQQIVPNSKLALVHTAILNSCDRQDGVADSVINDPRECRFDLATLRCPRAETPDCLSSEQIATLQAIYQGPRDARTGKQIYPGFPFGSEGTSYGDASHPGWSNFWADPDDPTQPQRVDFFRHWVFNDANWDWWKFNWGSDVDIVTAAMGTVLNATDPDLSKFRARGGKLIMFIGWNDPVGSAFEAINYYESVVARGTGGDGPAKLTDTQKFARLYVVPGMSHTATGPGATYFSNATRDSAPPVDDSRHDMGLALLDWVEKGIAPGDLIGTHFSEGSGPTGRVQFQRPVCVFPKTLRYRGGDTNAAASFECAAPAPLLAGEPDGRGDRYSGTQWATRSPVIAANGMAATSHPLASQVAIDILKQGGSAVDAAIAANAALALMEPISCGIGGDLFAIVWDPRTKKLYGYNASGRAPAGRDLAATIAKAKAVYARMNQPYAAKIPKYGSLSVTVPGAVDGWFALHERFGKLRMADNLAPAIRYAKAGFPVTQMIAMNWQRNIALFESNRAMIEEFDNARHVYVPNGHTPVEGEVFRNPDLAAKLAQGGRDVYYKGAIARTADAYFQRIGADLKYSDFAAYRGEWVEPRSVHYRGYDVFELPPNSQGFGVLQMLQLLKPYDIKAMGQGSLAAVSTVLEAKRLAYEDMAKYYGDPGFAKIPIETLLSDAYAQQRRKLIDVEKPDPSVKPGEAQLSVGDTTYLTVADKNGMMVSLIQSNYRGLGSGLVADGLGFMFHDRAELFSLDPRSPNVYAPGKRPFHTIIPAFVMKGGEPYLAFGVMGGDMQAQGQVQVLLNIIDFGMNVQDAGDAARWYHGGSTTVTGEAATGLGTLAMESGFAPDVKQTLSKRGFKVIPPGLEYGTDEFGGYQAIQWDATHRVYWGASEMRKDGQVIGY